MYFNIDSFLRVGVMSLARLRLKKHEEKRLLQGHLWIYSNEVDTSQTPFTGFTAGELVDIEDSRGVCLGRGYVNPHTLLCTRLLTRDPRAVIDEAFFMKKVQSALQLREALFAKPYYRLIYGESDYLPGLIVDRYHDLLVVQITTAGMEALREVVISALQTVIAPSAILLRNDHGMRLLEGLPQYVTAALGDPPQQCTVEENDARFVISPWSGQKTGWFYDHRENRRQLQRFVSGKRVLDVFSYVGAWAIQAAVYGAKEVWAIDSSAPALAQCAENAELNQVKQLLKTCQGDAFDQLKKLVEDKMQFDVIILDPPAFIKKRKDYTQGFLAYKRLNTLALQLLSPRGYLVSASCSHHLSAQDLQQVVLSASVSSHRDLQILSHGHQGLDHPVHPAIPETDYLKALVCLVTAPALAGPRSDD